MAFEESYDLIIIGCGAAGMAAALSAAETIVEAMDDRVSIAVLERAPKSERGGNSRWTGAYMRMRNTSEVTDHFVDDMLKFSGGLSDERYIRALAMRVPETFAWLQEKGIRFEYLPTIFLTHAQPRLLPVGGGRALIEALARYLEDLGVPILYEMAAQRLIVGEDGLIAGLEVIDSRARLRRLGAKAVIIASGGFEGNSEMMTRYVGRNAFRLTPVAKGGYFNKGEGIRMALEIGAKPSGQWDAFHAEPVDPRSRMPEAVVMIFPYGILVNKSGQRFVDEGSSTVDEIYEHVARSIFYDQKEQIAYLIIDQKMYDIPDYHRALLTDQPPYQADSIEALAYQIGVPPSALTQTITEYNSATCDNRFGFDATRLDGLSTRNGLYPPKSNWARPIDSPPYLAYPVACSVVFTFGGIATNERAEVVTHDDVPIPGLYAAGEVTGLYYHKYPGSTSVMRSLVFGRLAGTNAAKYVLANGPRT